MTKNPLIDISTALPCVPFGSIDKATAYRKSSTKAKKLGNLPVLAGNFNLSNVKFDANQPVHLGWGAMHAPGMSLPLLTFRLQLGQDMLYWLANPWDPEIWAMLDSWAKTGMMAVAAEFGGRAFFASREYEFVPPIQALRDRALPSMSAPEKAAEFMQGAGAFLVAGQLPRAATTDIGSILQLRQVLGCTVETKTTGRIRVPLDVAAFAACDLLSPPISEVLAAGGTTLH